MIKEFMEKLAERYFNEHRADFGEDAVFREFLKAEGHLTVTDTYPATVFGYVAYATGDGVHLSSRMRIQYSVCDRSVARTTVSRWVASEAAFYGLIWSNVRRLTESPQQLVPKFCASTAHLTPTAFVAAVMFESPRAHQTWGYSRCLDYEHLALMGRRIGQFHGCVLRAKEVEAEPLVRAQRGLPELYSELNCRLLVPTLQRCLQPLFTDPLGAENASFAAGVQRLASKVARLDKCVAAVDNCPDRCRVLCHMNYSQASMFFKYEGTEVVDAMIGNWATAGFGSFGVDLAIWLFVEHDVAAGPAKRRHLIGEYYEALREACPPTCLPQLRDVVLEIKRCVPIALFALAARLVRLPAAPCLSMQTVVSRHWDDEFVRNVCKDLILSKYI